MNSHRQYHYDLPRRGIVSGVVLYVGLSLLMMHWAKHCAGIPFAVALLIMSVTFALLAEIVLTRRLVYPRVLDLMDAAILFQHGFLQTKIETIRYTDVIRIEDCGACIVIFTGIGRYEIALSYFHGLEHYRAVREFVATKTSIALPAYSGQRSAQLAGCPPRCVVHWLELPPPLVHWVEPEDWTKYRTHVAKSKPMLERLRNELWFFSSCLGFILFPWLLLQLSYLSTSSAKGFLGLSLLAAVFFTVLHWLNSTYPVHTASISVRDAGITRSACSGQAWDWNYHDFFGWAMIERGFKERILHILLLRHRAGVVALALPDASIRARLVQILNDKQVPEVPDLTPSWEGER